MRFTIGTHLYSVQVAAEPITDENGPKDGLCDRNERVVLISPEVPADRRLWVLGHELAHAWVGAVGRPKGEEGLANFVATLLVQAVKDLTINGGAFALFRQEPGEAPQPGASRVMLTKHRYCGTCRSSVAGGSVVCHPDPEHPGMMKLQIWCEYCNVLQIWRELATPTGIPTGTPDGDPWFGTREEISQFLREHGHLYGVRMAS